MGIKSVLKTAAGYLFLVVLGVLKLIFYVLRILATPFIWLGNGFSYALSGVYRYLARFEVRIARM